MPNGGYCVYYPWNIFGFENWGISLGYTTDSAGEYSIRWQVSTGQVREKNIWSQMDYKYVYPRNIMTHDNIVSFSHSFHKIWKLEWNTY